MRNSTYLKMGLNMLVHSKLRSWLTIIGIVIGIGSVVGILSLGDAMQEQVQSRLAEMDLTKITISPTSAPKSNGGFFGFLKSNNPTPTPTQKPASSIIINTSENNIYKQNNQVAQQSNARSIPSTGLPTLFLPLLFSGLIGGSILRKVGKK